MMSRPAPARAPGRCDRRGVIVEVEVLHSPDGFFLGDLHVAFRLHLGFAFAVGIFGIAEDAEKLFALETELDHALLISTWKVLYGDSRC